MPLALAGVSGEGAENQTIQPFTGCLMNSTSQLANVVLKVAVRLSGLMTASMGRFQRVCRMSAIWGVPKQRPFTISNTRAKFYPFIL